MRRTQAEEQFSQELQLHGMALADRLDWTAGVLYFTETASLEAANIILAPLLDGMGLTRGTAKNESLAAYLQVTDTITPKVRVTAGARYNVDWRQLISANAIVVDGLEVCRLIPEVVDTAGVCKATLPKEKFNYVPFTVGVDYTTADSALLYAKVSRGQRAGGYNMRGGTPLGLLSFGPEVVTSYEVGAKTDLFHQRLRVDLALFHSDYDDIQLGQFVSDPIQGFTIIKQNAGQAWIEGGELEITALLGRLRISGAFGYAHGEYTKLEPGVVDVVLGDEVALPTTTHSIGADLPFSLKFGSINLHADYAGHNDDSGLTHRCICDNTYALLNATAMFKFNGTNLELGLWGRNLTSKHYQAQAVDFGFFINEVPGDPRTYGITATYSFGSSHAPRH